MDDKTKTAIKEVGLPVAGAVVSIFTPFIGVPLAGAAGIWSLIDKWREDRIDEVKRSVGEKEILDLIKQDDKTRDILNRILFSVFQESSVKKRQLYYSYIKQLHNGLHPDYDYHSKVILTINLVTFDEIKTLVEFAKKYPEILKVAFEKSKGENPKGEVNESENRGVNLSEIILVKPFSTENENKLEDELVNFGNYGLLSVKSGRMDGTLYGPITEFGKIFLDFIFDGK